MTKYLFALVQVFCLTCLIQSETDINTIERLALVANDNDDTYDSLYNDYYYDSLDYESKMKVYFKELDPTERLCKLTYDKQDRMQVVCYRGVPKTCNQICRDLNGLNFEFDALESYAFSGYEINEPVEFRFKNLKIIQSDAWNGMVVAKNVKMTIYIEGSAETDLLIAPNAFEDLKLHENAQLSIKISNYRRLEFQDRSLTGITYSNHSELSLKINNANLLVFKSGSMRSWTPRAASKVYVKLNATKVNELFFEKNSFSGIKQTHQSVFQLVASSFRKCSFSSDSFSDINQANSSTFLVKLQGEKLVNNERVFAGLTQAYLSKFIMFFQIANSSVCIKPYTFSNIRQNFNSTFRTTFMLEDAHSLTFNKHSLTNCIQAINSKFEIYALRPNKFVLESEALVNMTQNKQSFFEIWVSKAKTSFKIKHIGIKGFVQAEDSTFNIGFTSSKSGHFEQSPNAFSQFTSEPSSQVVYDFSRSSKFKLSFAPRPVPRFLPISLQAGSDAKESIEEISYKIYPNLGRTSRPDNLSLKDYSLKAEDFCKIIDIPFDVQVKLRANTECSCSVYFLFRMLRKIHKNLNMNWLINAPECYQNKFISILNNETKQMSTVEEETKLDKVQQTTHLNELNDLTMLEDMCHFEDMVKSCRETNEMISDSMPEVIECDSSFDYYEPRDSTESTYPSLNSYQNDLELADEKQMIVDQYEDDYYRDDKVVLSDYVDIDSSINYEMVSNGLNKKDKAKKTFLFGYLFEKLSLMVLFATGAIISILFSSLVVISVINKFRSRNKAGFVETSTETYHRKGYEDANDHIYSTIPGDDNSQLVTSVKHKLDKKHNIKYSKFRNQSLDSSFSTENTSTMTMNSQNKLFV